MQMQAALHDCLLLEIPITVVVGVIQIMMRAVGMPLLQPMRGDPEARCAKSLLEAKKSLWQKYKVATLDVPSCLPKTWMASPICVRTQKNQRSPFSNVAGAQYDYKWTSIEEVSSIEIKQFNCNRQEVRKRQEVKNPLSSKTFFLASVCVQSEKRWEEFFRLSRKSFVRYYTKLLGHTILNRE